MKQPGNKIKALGKDNALWVENQRIRGAVERVRQMAIDAVAEAELSGDKVTLLPSAILKALDGKKEGEEIEIEIWNALNFPNHNLARRLAGLPEYEGDKK